MQRLVCRPATINRVPANLHLESASARFRQKASPRQSPSFRTLLDRGLRTLLDRGLRTLLGSAKPKPPDAAGPAKPKPPDGSGPAKPPAAKAKPKPGALRRMMPNYKAMTDEQKEEARTDFIIKFAGLARYYPQYKEWIKPKLDEPLELLHVRYEKYLRRVSIDKGNDQYKIYLIIFFLVVELLC